MLVEIVGIKGWTRVGEKKFWHGRRIMHFFPRSLDETSVDDENIAMLLVTQELNAPPVSTTSELSISHIDNGSISIAVWIAYKRIIWGRLPPRPPPEMTLPLILHHLVVLFLVLFLSQSFILFVKGLRRRTMQL